MNVVVVTLAFAAAVLFGVSLWLCRHRLTWTPLRKKAAAVAATAILAAAGVGLLATGNHEGDVQDPAAYLYTYPPAGSLGASVFKTLNWSYWQGWLDRQFQWTCQKSTNKTVWSDAGQYLRVDTGFDGVNQSAKVTIVLNTTGAPLSYYYRFVLDCNESLLSYVNHSSLYEYDLTLPANLTENYTVAFNFSDLKPLLQQGKLTVSSNVTGGVFHCYVSTVTKIQSNKLFVIDPTFGMGAAYTSAAGIGNYIRYFTATNCTSSGKVATMTIYTYTNSGKQTRIKTALYQWVSNTNVGTRLATTAERTLTGTGSWGWQTFRFNTSYSVVTGTKYCLAAWSNYTSTSVGYAAGNGGNVALTYGSWPSPMTSETDQSRNYSMYVTYYRPATLGSTVQTPTNGTTGVHLSPSCNISVSEPDGKTGNLYWWTNETGSWVLHQTNSSIANGTYKYTFTGASSYYHTYYYKTAFNDTYNNVTAWYSFTTQEGPYSGPNYYVNGTSGNDANNGSFNHPFKTIQKAVNVSVNGDTIFVMAGTYLPSTGQIIITNKNTPSSWLTIRNYNSDYVLINGTNCPTGYPGFTWNSVIEFSNSKYIRVSGLHVNHSARGAFDVQTTSSHIRIDNCSMSNCSVWAIKCQNGVNNITAEHNYVYKNFNNWSGVWASNEVFSFENVKTFNISNNTFIGNSQLNIDVKGGGSLGKICYNNINTTAGLCLITGFHLYGGAGVYIDAQGIVKNVSIYNNKIYGNNTGISLNTETTGHYEYIYVYNNVINMTNKTGGAPSDIGSGRIPMGLANTGISSDLFHNIYIYSNTISTGINNIYSTFTVGHYTINQWPTNNLQKVYIVNNIFHTDVSTGSYIIFNIRHITYESGVFIMDRNSFYRSTNPIYCYWNGTTYSSGSNPEKFGTNAVFASPLFQDVSNDNFHLTSLSPCVNTGNSTLVPLVDFDGVTRPQGAGYDIGAYENGTSTYTVTVRNTGEDYFQWLGTNQTAYFVNQSIVGLNAASESISIWNRTTWSSSTGGWQTYNGTRTGVNWTVHTFQIIRIILADSGTQVITMTQNTAMASQYTASQAIPLVNQTKNHGYNYSGYNMAAATTLSVINTTKIGLAAGDMCARWNRTTYDWDYWISGFSTVNDAVSQWDVILTKVSSSKTFNT